MSSLSGDLSQLRDDVHSLRTAAALSGLPSSRVRTTIEEGPDGTMRLGITNVATGGVHWLTEFF
jgi:hypothetical protein